MTSNNYKRTVLFAVFATLVVLIFNPNITLGDVNGDGNLDAVFGNSFVSNRICLGDGTGAFNCSAVEPSINSSKRTGGVALENVNGDGNVDAVFSNNNANAPSTERNRLCLGDGTGTFICSNVSADDNQTIGVAMGDVNSDGSLDIVFANFSGRNRLCLGDGVGGFNCFDLSSDVRASIRVSLGDVNGDGKLDARSQMI